MIPIKLTMRNFMPYRENVPTLDFTGIHLVSICGDNGNGKSAIIDAMTWALWGETRAKRDDDLIHQNAIKRRQREWIHELARRYMSMVSDARSQLAT